MNYKELEKQVDNLLSQYDKKRVEEFIKRDEKRMSNLKTLSQKEIEANRSSACKYLFTDKNLGGI